MGSILDGSYGFCSGNLNTGEAGKGWGINTSIYFQVVTDRVYTLTHTGGLVIDLYSLVYMNPMEKIDFLIDSSMIDQKYISVTQENNLVYLIPNTQAILEDNYISNKFKINVEMVGSNGSNSNVNITIDYVQTYVAGSNSYEIIYNALDYKIPLTTLLLNSSDFTQAELNTINIKFINGIPYSNTGLENLISNDSIDTSVIAGLVNPVIDYEFDINDNIYSGTLKFMNFIQETIPETQLSMVQSYITPVNGDFIDVKKFVTGDTYNLMIKPAGSMNKDTKAFKIETCGHYISIIPNTVEAFKLTNTEIFTQKFVYETDRSRGVFDLNITMNPKALNNSPTVLDSLVPIIKNITLTISNKLLQAGTPGINLEPLLGNRIFDPSNPVKIGFGDNGNNVQSLRITNVNGPHLYQDDSNSGLPSSIKLNFVYNDNTILNTAIKNITFEDDKILVRDPFEVAPMIFNVTKNSCKFDNVFNYITVNKSELKHITIEHIDSTLLDNVTNTDLVTVKPLLYRSTPTFAGPEDHVIETEIVVKNNNTFIDPNHKDDFGNIIGYRKIPVTINFISDLNSNITDTDLVFNTIKMRFINTPDFKFEYSNYIQNIDVANIKNGVTKFTNISLDSSSTIQCEIIQDEDGTKNYTKDYGILWNNAGYFLLGNIQNSGIPNPKIVLKIEYLNSNNETKTYFQTINLIYL